MSHTTATALKTETTETTEITAEITAEEAFAMTETTQTIETTDATPKARHGRRPMRWLLALLTIAATVLGGMAISQQVAGAASGTAYAQVCSSTAGAKVRAIVSLPNNRQWVSGEATANARGCATVAFPTNRVVRFTVQKTTGNCSFYCYVTTGNSGWLSSNGTVPGRTYPVYVNANTIVIDSGYQAAQTILNGF